MSLLLEAFEKEFLPGTTTKACTWRRDYDWKATDAISQDELRKRMMEGPRIIPWGKEVRLDGSEEDTKQRLKSLKLLWDMEVDELFYVGDEQLQIKGLLNGDFEEATGGTVLVEPLAFGKLAQAGKLEPNMFPCKWLQIIGRERFAYNRQQLEFRLCWPNWHTAPLDNRVTYVGGLTFLTKIKTEVDA